MLSGGWEEGGGAYISGQKINSEEDGDLISGVANYLC